MSGTGESLTDVLEAVRQTDWASWMIPGWGGPFEYRHDRIIPAFESLILASSAEQARAPYDEMLDALGHNHSGTAFPAMAPGTRLLARLIPHLGVGAAPAMEVVVDAVLWTSSRPAFHGPDGLHYDLGLETFEAAVTLGALAEQWQRGDDGDRKGAAAALMGVLSTRAQQS